jgi:xanthine dehydrogenase YagR molybdenum-binding subunit
LSSGLAPPPAGRGHRWRLIPHRHGIHNAGAAVIAKLADLATGDQRSPLFGAGNAGVISRGGRLFRRDHEWRSESNADILDRAGLTEIEARGKSAADPAAQSTYAMHAHGAVFAEVKVDPDLGQMRVTRIIGGPQPRYPMCDQEC